MLTAKRIAIIGREKQTRNYRRALSFFSIRHEVTLSVGRLSEFDALLLPGGGDIDPCLLNEPDNGSKNIDTELDIIQFQALDLFVKNQKPVLGICKGFQLIDLYFGAKLIQDLPRPSIHPVTENGEDSFHEVTGTPLPACRLLSAPALRPAASDGTAKSDGTPASDGIAKSDGTPALRSFPAHFTVNSAHHQGILQNGRGLLPFQTAPDGITEAVLHETLPLLGYQWHPERMLLSENPVFQETGRLAFELFFSFLG